MNCDHKEYNQDCFDCVREKMERYKEALEKCWLAVDEFFHVTKGLLPNDTIKNWNDACEIMRKDLGIT